MKECKQYTVSYHGDQSVTCPGQQKLVSRGIHTNPVHVINYEESQEGGARRGRERPEGGERDQREEEGDQTVQHWAALPISFTACVHLPQLITLMHSLTALCDSMSTKNLAMGCREGHSIALSNISALSRLE